MSSTTHAPVAGSDRVASEAARRRTFAIISHPDAGKTTLTEKLLLYSGAVAEAGAVKARSGRREVTSDWMDLERRRGISVSSTALRFEHRDVVFNLLDTPGHRDFSEDTLRVLAAADCAVILLDAARGVEAQTLKLFEVARARGIPLITFVNKYDRPGMEPLELIDHVEQTLGLSAVPISWPVGIPGDFRGVLDRDGGRFVRFTRTARGATMAPEQELSAQLARDEEGDAWTAAVEELELLHAAGAAWDRARFAGGELTPVLFGSALSNFGVRHLLDTLIELAPPPAGRVDADGGVRALQAPFSALVFKVQANMDPRHRDRIAFMRICSGRFERGMRALNARTGRPIALAYAHELFGQDRTVVDDAYPGDVIGIVNATDVLVGDTLYVDEPVRFGAIPTLAPEHFVTVQNRDPSRSKQFRRGLQQLDQEGVVHVLRRGDDPAPILAAVGPLQFDVAVERLQGEFGVSVGLDARDWSLARRVSPDDAAAVRASRWAELLTRADGTQLAVFRHRYSLEQLERDLPDVALDAMTAR
ncbi:MAG: peptide chain release factor 3 [Solirubrobacteraceae bacterium]|nr:peptide chain release factor 3 [Solirubrobacteraceae bacterium]